MSVDVCAGTSLQVLTARVFDRGESLTLSRESLHAAVLDARDGDEQALGLLVLGFAFLLRKQVRPYSGVMSADDARMAAVLGVHAAARAVDEPRAFASVVGDYVRDALKEAAGEVDSIPVPSRTLTRYFGILREADGDAAVAVRLADSHSMTRETFYAISDALKVSHLDAQPAGWAEPHGADLFYTEDEEDLCAAALAALTTQQEADVVEAAYGFSDYRPHSDSEIAGELALSRPKVQRVRSGALVKMREALCVTEDADA